VPSVRPAQGSDQSRFQAQDQPRDQAALAPGAPLRAGPGAPGGSFLGTAAAAAAGMIGGSLMLDGIRSMMGSGHGAFGMTDPAYGASHSGSPWDSGAGGDLSRQAGVNDIGGDQHAGGGASGLGQFDNTADATAADDQADQDVASYDDSGGDFDGGGDFGGSDA